jgi:hypothetical protein
MPSMFWTNVEFKTGTQAGAYVQCASVLHLKKKKIRVICFQSVTGCIDPSTVDRLKPDDSGGQYDSSGGIDEAGNPAGSTCAG